MKHIGRWIICCAHSPYSDAVFNTPSNIQKLTMPSILIRHYKHMSCSRQCLIKNYFSFLSLFQLEYFSVLLVHGITLMNSGSIVTFEITVWLVFWPMLLSAPCIRQWTTATVSRLSGRLCLWFCRRCFAGNFCSYARLYPYLLRSQSHCPTNH